MYIFTDFISLDGDERTCLAGQVKSFTWSDVQSSAEERILFVHSGVSLRAILKYK